MCAGWLLNSLHLAQPIVSHGFICDSCCTRIFPTFCISLSKLPHPQMVAAPSQKHEASQSSPNPAFAKPAIKARGWEFCLVFPPKRSHLGKKGHRSAHVSGTPLLFATSWSLKLHVKASSQNKNPWHNTHRRWRRFNSLRFREMSPSRLMIAGLNFQENKETNV